MVQTYTGVSGTINRSPSRGGTLGDPRDFEFWLAQQQPYRIADSSSVLMKRILLLGIVLLGLVSSSLAQEGNEDVVLSEPVMKQLLRPIIKHYFKPRHHSRAVYIRYVKESCLLRIPHVRFVVVDELSSDSLQNGFVLESLTRSKQNVYFVNFGYGALGCGDRMGDIWSFRLTKSGQVKELKQIKGGWGSACDRSVGGLVGNRSLIMTGPRLPFHCRWLQPADTTSRQKGLQPKLVFESMG